MQIISPNAPAALKRLIFVSYCFLLTMENILNDKRDLLKICVTRYITVFTLPSYLKRLEEKDYQNLNFLNYLGVR